MAGTFTFHNKFHRSNHHTVSSPSVIDSGTDPIASRNNPFLGIFYNVLTDSSRSFTIPTNSFEWWSAYTTMSGNSSRWMKTETLYTTVCSFSSNWNSGYNGYTTLRSNSSLYESAYSTVCAFSASWGSPLLMFTNKVQEYTHAKTFSGVDLVGNLEESPVRYSWNLDLQQVAFIRLKADTFIQNPLEETIVNGGMYTLVFLQDNPTVAGTGHQVLFDTSYRFSNVLGFQDVVSMRLSAVTIINFLAIDVVMYGDVVVLSGNI